MVGGLAGLALYTGEMLLKLIMELDNLGSAESSTIMATRLPGDKFSVRSGTSTIETVILADQVLELRMRGELINCLRKRKMTEAYSRLAAR